MTRRIITEISTTTSFHTVTACTHLDLLEVHVHYLDAIPSNTTFTGAKVLFSDV